MSNPDVTQGLERQDAGDDSSLTDFLAPSQADDELGRLGKYRILKILGHGGMGVVYQAEDPELKRKIALKAMLPTLAASASAGKRFLREAQAMAAVEHDHVVRIYQVDKERGNVCDYFRLGAASGRGAGDGRSGDAARRELDKLFRPRA